MRLRKGGSAVLFVLVCGVFYAVGYLASDYAQFFAKTISGSHVGYIDANYRTTGSINGEKQVSLPGED